MHDMKAVHDAFAWLGGLVDPDQNPSHVHIAPLPPTDPGVPEKQVQGFAAFGKVEPAIKWSAAVSRGPTKGAPVVIDALNQSRDLQLLRLYARMGEIQEPMARPREAGIEPMTLPRHRDRLGSRQWREEENLSSAACRAVETWPYVVQHKDGTLKAFRNGSEAKGHAGMRKNRGAVVLFVSMGSRPLTDLTMLLPRSDKAKPPKGSCGTFCGGQSTKAVQFSVATHLTIVRVY